MAAAAFGGYAGKAESRMTLAAGNGVVLSFQGKPGARMVKLLAGPDNFP
jgi:hypothetical protein